MFSPAITPEELIMVQVLFSSSLISWIMASGSFVMIVTCFSASKWQDTGNRKAGQYRPYDYHQIRKHCLDFFVHKGLLFVSKIVCQQ